MNSAVKLMPKTLLRSASRLACLAGLLLSASAFGQATWTAGSGITINDASLDPANPNVSRPAKAAPYGVEITTGTSTPTGKSLRAEHTIQKVAVVLQNLTHSYFADLDILLTGPNSGKVLLMSDVALNQGTQATLIPGGSTVASIRIDNGVEFPAGISPAINASTTYKPTNYDGDSNTEIPDIAGPYAGNFSAFVGLSPRETSWKLYVVDDRNSDFGSLGPWQLLLWLNPYATIEGKTPGQTHEVEEINEDTTLELTVTVDDPDSADENIAFTIASGNTALFPNTYRAPGELGSDKPGYSWRKDGSNFKLLLRPAANANSESATDIAVNIQDKRGDTVLGTVPIASVRVKKVKAVNDAPTVGKLIRVNDDNSETEVTEIVADQGRLSKRYKLEVGDVDTNNADLSKLVVEGITGTPTLVANGDIFASGTGSPRELRMAPRGDAPLNSPATGTFTIVVKDPAGATATKNITFKVNPVTDRHFRANPDLVNMPASGANPTQSALTVSGISAQGINADIERVTVTLADVSHNNPSDMTVVLRGPNNKAVVLMHNVGGTGGGAKALRKTRITFDDTAAAIPADGPIVVNDIAGETYAPTRGSGDLPSGFPGSADILPTLAQAFQGTPANGTWTLFAIDRNTGEAGVINGGFLLTIWARPVIAGLPTTTDPIVFQEDGAQVTYTMTLEDTDGRVLRSKVEEVGSPSRLTITDGDKTHKASDGEVLADPVTHTFRVQPRANAFGRTQLKVTVWDANPPTGKTSVDGFRKELVYNVDIRAINDPPTVTEIPKQTVWLGQVVTRLDFTIGDPVELIEAPNAVNVSIESDNIKLLPPQNIKLIPGAVAGNKQTQAYQISLFPNAGEIGLANVKITVRDSGQRNTILGEIPDNDTRRSAETFLRLEVKGEPSKTVSVLNGIVINESATPPTKATPYPSTTADIKDLAGRIASIKLNVYGFESTSPQDVGIALVKGNRGILLMQDQGGSSLQSGVQLRFEDGAEPLPSTLESGVWRPKGGNPVPSSFPNETGVIDFNTVTWFSNFRTAFEGVDPNGVWSLYVVDDTTNVKANDRITSWMLTIETKPALTDVTTVNITEGKDQVLEIDLGDNQPGVPFGIVLTEISSPPDGTLLTSYEIDQSLLGDKRRITLKPAANVPLTVKTAQARIRIVVTNPQGDTSTDEFDLVATQDNDAPTITGLPTQNGVRVVAGVVSSPIPFTIGDVETGVGDLAGTLEVLSGDTSILPNANIVRTGSGASHSITILPNGAQNLTVPIIVRVTDKGSTATTDGSDKKTTEVRFQYTAEQSDRLAFGNRSQITFVDNNKANPYPYLISVGSGIRGLVGTVTASLHGLRHDYPGDINLVLESPTGRKVVLLSNAGGSNPANSIKTAISISLNPDGTLARVPEIPSGPLAPGIYRSAKYNPSINFGGGDPGSTADISEDLAVFFGDQIVGNWKVYAYDDSFGDVGVIENGVSLAFRTAPTVQLGEPETIQMDEDVKKVLTLTILDTDSESNPANVTITATTIEGGDILPSANLKFLTPNNGITRSLEMEPAANRSGDVKIRLTISDGTFTTQREVKIKVNAVDDPPQVRFTWWTPPIDKPNETPAWPAQPEDVATQTIQVQVRDLDSDLALANATINSDNTSIVPNNQDNLRLQGPDTIPAGEAWTTTVNALVRPAANAFGRPQIFVAFRDARSTTTSNFFFQVDSRNDLPEFSPADYVFANFTGDRKVKVGETRSTATFRVTDVETQAKDINVIVRTSAEDIIPSNQMEIARNGNERIISFRAVGQNGANGIQVFVKLEDGNSGQSVEKFFLVDVEGPQADPTRVFANTERITVPGSGTSGKATPYGSAITLPTGTLKGDIFRVGVVLDGFKHAVPDDMDILLQGPDGTTVVLMSDVGGTVAVDNLRLEFADDGSDLRDDGPLTSGRFKPANFDGASVDTWPDVTLNGLGTSLAAFRGKNPNGTWRLFIIDDATSHVGEITKGWALSLVTTPVVLVNGEPTKSSSIMVFDEDSDPTVSPTISNFQVADPDAGTPLDKLAITLSSTDANVIPARSANIVYNDTARTFRIIPAAHQFANPNSDNDLPEVSYTVSRGDASWTYKVKTRIRPRNDDPIISRLVPVTMDESTTYRLVFQVEDNDINPRDKIRVSVTSDTQSVVRDSDIRFEGTTVNVLDNVDPGQFVVNITPVSTVVGTATITVRVNDKSTLANHTIPNGQPGSPNFPPVGVADNANDNNDEATFVLTVAPRNDPPDITPIVETIGAVAGTPKTVQITVNDPDHRADQITITGKSDNQAYIRDGSISVVTTSPANKVGETTWVVTFTPELNIKGNAVITLTSKDAGNATDTATINVSIGPSRARRYESTEKITINDFLVNGGRATPYPSTITVGDLVGDVASIRLELNGFSHPYPDDVDIILVNPSGTAVKVLSDAGGSTRADKVNLTISDSGSSLPDLGPLVNGATYRPGDYEADPNIPSGNPAGPFLTTLNDFAGRPAAGQWKLFVLDDTAQDAGEILSWALQIETRPSIRFVNNPADITILEDGQINVPFTLVDEAAVAGQVYEFSFASSDTTKVLPSALSVVPSPKEPQYAVVGFPVLESVGVATITVSVKGKDYPNLIGQNSFKVTTTAVNDVPFITEVGDRVIDSGKLSVVEGFDYGDAETPKKDLNFTVSSSNPELIPNSSIIPVGNRLLIIPAGTRTGTSTITLSVRDAQNQTATRVFRVEVKAVLHYQIAATSSGTSEAPITIRDLDTATLGRGLPYPSLINVSGLKGRVSRVAVALSKFTHKYPSDVDILLVGPNNTGVILFSDAGGGIPVANGWFELDDAAANVLPANPTDALASGTWKPTNHDTASDDFPSDAPPRPSNGFGTSLTAAFQGIDPNGQWKLYVRDDSTGDGGLIEDWVLNIYTDQPSVGTIANQTTDENVPITVSFRVEDANTPIASLGISVIAENSGLVTSAKPNCVGNNCTVVLTPVPFQNGSTRITVTATDGTSEDSSEFTLTVRPVNFAPTITGLSDKTVPSNRILRVPFVVADPDFEDTAASLTAGAVVLKPELGAATVEGTNENRVLVFTPSGGQGGTELRITVQDTAGAKTEQTINVTIGPKYTLVVAPITDKLVDEDGTLSVPVTVSGSESGNINVIARSGDTNLVNDITVTGAGTSWLVTLKPAKDQTGTTTIVVVASDEFGTGEEDFNLTVTPTPDAPVIAPIPDQVTTKNVAARVTLEVSDADSDITTLTYTGDFSNASLVTNVRFGVNDSNQIVATVNLVQDAVGTSSVTIFADDGSTKTARSFLLVVNEPPNRPPVLAPIPNQSTTKNVPARVPILITDPDTEVTAILYTAEFSNTALVRNVRFGIDNNNNVIATVNLVANEIGTSSITIFADDGATKVARSFILTVTEPPNEPPVFGPIEDQITTANTPVTVVLNITDPDTALTDLKFTATASNSRVISGVTFNATTASVTATVNPVQDATGVSTVTITADDGKNKVSQVFAIAVNEAPEPEFAKPTLTTNADGSKTISITWENGGELEWADSAAGPWTATGNKTGSYSEPATAASRVYRIKR